MQVEQYVMAYEVEQDRLRALLPAGFVSLRPVLRINGEIRRGPKETAYLELNTPVEGHGKRGWLNVGHWDSRTAELSYAREGKPCPPLQQLPRRRMKSAPSPRKTRRPFPAGRCWGPMWFGGSGGRTRRSRGPERGSRFG